MKTYEIALTCYCEVNVCDVLFEAMRIAMSTGVAKQACGLRQWH